jgi:hypothetical protein
LPVRTCEPSGSLACVEMGYSGSGYADFPGGFNGTGANEEYVRWTFTTTKPGTHTLTFRYACNAPTGNNCRPLDLWVNGAFVATVPFLGTGAWTTYLDNPAVSVALNNSMSGANQVELRAVNNVGPNIDKLTIASQ